MLRTISSKVTRLFIIPISLILVLSVLVAFSPVVHAQVNHPSVHAKLSKPETISITSCQGVYDVIISANDPDKQLCFIGSGYMGLGSNDMYGVYDLFSFVQGGVSWVKYYDNTGGHIFDFGYGDYGCPPFCYHGTVKLTQIDVY